LTEATQEDAGINNQNINTLRKNAAELFKLEERNKYSFRIIELPITSFTTTRQPLVRTQLT